MAIGDISIKDAKIAFLRKGVDDFQSTGAGGNVTGTSLTAINTLNFTPDASHDYLFLAQIMLGATTASKYVFADFYDNNGADSYNNRVRYAHNAYTTPEYLTAVNILLVLPALSGAQSFSLRVAAESGNTAVYQRSMVMAINLDKYPNYYYAENRTAQVSNSTTPLDKITLSETLNGNQHVLLGATHHRVGNTSNISHARTLWNDEVLAHNSVKPHLAGNDFASHFLVHRHYPRPGTHDYKIQGWVNGDFGFFPDTALCLIEYNDNPSVNLLGNYNLNGKLRVA